MKKYKCLIVDDEELARELMVTHISQFPDFEIVSVCHSAIDAHRVLKANAVDLIFLDIEMPVLKGTDFLKNLSTPPKVIFTTAHRKYAMEGFELDVVDYLLKPIVFQRFLKAIEKFYETKHTQLALVPENQERTHLFVQYHKKNIKVLFDDILFVESKKDYINIVTNEKRLLIKHGLTDFEHKLDNRFIRLHRSYIINKDKVTAYTKQDVEIGEQELPIGDLYKSSVIEKLKD